MNRNMYYDNDTQVPGTERKLDDAPTDFRTYEAIDDDTDDASPSFAEPAEYDCEEGEARQLLPMLLKVLFHPVPGWKKVRRSDIPADKWAQSCFYPLTAFCAVSSFAERFYNPYVSLDKLLIDAVGQFIALFFGYFIISGISGAVLSRAGSESLSRNFGKVFTLICLSSIALFLSLYNLLPMFEPALVFTPLWTVYLVYRGVKFLHTHEKHQALTVIVLSLLVIGVPVALYWMFLSFLPTKL